MVPPRRHFVRECWSRGPASFNLAIAKGGGKDDVEIIGRDVWAM